MPTIKPIDLVEFNKYALPTQVNQLVNKLNEIIAALPIPDVWCVGTATVYVATHTGEQIDMSDTNKGQVIGLANNPLRQTNTDTGSPATVKDAIAGLHKNIKPHNSWGDR